MRFLTSLLSFLRTALCCVDMLGLTYVICLGTSTTFFRGSQVELVILAMKQRSTQSSSLSTTASGSLWYPDRARHPLHTSEAGDSDLLSSSAHTAWLMLLQWIKTIYIYNCRSCWSHSMLRQIGPSTTRKGKFAPCSLL